MGDRKTSFSLGLGGLWQLLLILLCVATCDDCSGCRENAKSLYCEPAKP